MFCTKCGKEIPEEAKFCPHCGASTNGEPQPNANRDTYFTPPPAPRYQQQPAQQTQETNTMAIVGFVLSFFITIAGLICSIIGYRNADSQYGGNGKGLALAGIIISAISMVIAFVCVIVVISFAGYYHY